MAVALGKHDFHRPHHIGQLHVQFAHLDVAKRADENQLFIRYSRRQFKATGGFLKPLRDASRSLAHRNRGRAGQALLISTISLSLMFGLLGLAVDLGWAYYRRDAAQTAADAAAGAAVKAAMLSSPSAQSCGVSGVWCGSPAGTATSCPSSAPANPSSSFDYACLLAASNGFLPSGSSRTITVQANTTSPAPTVPGTTVNYWVTVRIAEATTPFFGSQGNGSGLTSGAIATAGITSTGTSTSNPCMYLLGTTGTTLSIGNGATVKTSSCGVYDNSSSTSAVFVTGGAKLDSSTVRIVGNYSVNNGGSITSTPTTGVSAMADPFASLPSPTVTSCSGGNYTNWQPTPYALTPGSYCGMSIGNGMGATLAAGNYIINGGTFSIQGGSTVTGAGVMIYLTNGATVNIANGANVTMSAPASGSYQGILFYQDRSIASPGGSTFAGGANMHLSGSLYFSKAALTIDNGANAQTMAIVAKSATFQGGATLNQATSQSQTGLPVGGGPTASMIQ